MDNFTVPSPKFHIKLSLGKHSFKSLLVENECTHRYVQRAALPGNDSVAFQIVGERVVPGKVLESWEKRPKLCWTTLMGKWAILAAERVSID